MKGLFPWCLTFWGRVEVFVIKTGIKGGKLHRAVGCVCVFPSETHTHTESWICSENGEAKCEFFSLFASQAERWVGRVVVMAFATVLPVAHRVGWYVRHDSFKLRQPAPSVGNGAFSPCLTVFCCLGLLAVSLTALQCTRDGTDWS